MRILTPLSAPLEAFIQSIFFSLLLHLCGATVLTASNGSTDGEIDQTQTIPLEKVLFKCKQKYDSSHFNKIQM